MDFSTLNGLETHTTHTHIHTKKIFSNFLGLFLDLRKLFTTSFLDIQT